MPDTPLVLRPHRLVLVCRGAAAALVLVFGVVAVSLRSASAGQVFGLGDQVAMFVLGLLLAGCVLLLTRARVEADETGIRVRNVVGETVLPWQVVRAVRLDDGNAWASLDLQDDDSVSLLAVQTNDGERAVEAVLALRRLLRSAHAGESR